MEYSDEQFKKILLRNLSTHFNAYWSIQNGKDNKLSPKELKKYLMEDFSMPESSARACVKDLMGENHGLFRYCKDEDYLVVDDEYVDEFYENMEYFLRRRIATANQIAELEEELDELRQSNSRQAKTIDRYIKAYGRELLNG